MFRMVAPESVAEKPFQLAIGRSVDPAWVEHFVDVVGSSLPRSSELRPYTLPGIAYVLETEMDLPKEERAKSQSDRQTYLENRVSSLIASLDDDGEPDRQTATTGIVLPLRRDFRDCAVSFKQRASYTRIGVWVDDTPDSPNPDDDLIHIDAEKDFFLDLFDPSRLEPARTDPRHRLFLGVIFGNVESRRLDHKKLGKELQDPVPFSGIGVLRLDTAA